MKTGCNSVPPPLYVWCSKNQKCITAELFSNLTLTKGSSKADRTARRQWPCPMTRRCIGRSDSDVHLDTDVSTVKATVNSHCTQSGHYARRWWSWPLHRRFISPHDGDVCLDIDRSVTNATVLRVHHGQLLTAHDDFDYHRRPLLLRPKFDCDGGYEVIVTGLL
jgi:hypothetical protein